MTEGLNVEQWPDIPGRNDNCLCGSGKKYKKCCQQKLEAEEVEYEQASCEVRSGPGTIEVLEVEGN